jgi:hypothetical protein
MDAAMALEDALALADVSAEADVSAAFASVASGIAGSRRSLQVCCGMLHI